MSVNESGTECTNCGDYNCTYLCIGCVIRILISTGLSLNESISILKEKHGITIDDYIIEEIKRG